MARSRDLKSVVKGRAGSTPALGTNDFISSRETDHLILNFRTGFTQFAQPIPIEFALIFALIKVMSKTRIIEAVRKLDLESIKKLLDDNPSLLSVTDRMGRN